MIHDNEKMQTNKSIGHLTDLDLIDIGKRYSLVQVYFENPMKNVITQDAKITLAGMISNIGGTLGIFLGLSMITLYDKFYQIFINIKNLSIHKKKNLLN